MSQTEELSEKRNVRNYVGGSWADIEGSDSQPVVNSATGETITHVEFSAPATVDRVVTVAAEAFEEWR